MDESRLKSAIEAILFAAGEPVPAARVWLVLGVREEDVTQCASRLAQEDTGGERGVRLLTLEDKLQVVTTLLLVFLTE